MQTLKNTLNPQWERWDDPGDYPCAAGSGPLPSTYQFAGVDGVLVLQLTPDELADFQEAQEDGYLRTFLELLTEDADLPSGVNIRSWEHKLEGNRLTLTVERAEPE